MKPVKDVDEYIAVAPKEVQGKLKEFRATIKTAAPSAQEIINNLILSYSLSVGDFVSSDFLSIKKLICGSIFIWLSICANPHKAFTAFIPFTVSFCIELNLVIRKADLVS
jgi:hypothetical protein